VYLLFSWMIIWSARLCASRMCLHFWGGGLFWCNGAEWMDGSERQHRFAPGTKPNSRDELAQQHRRKTWNQSEPRGSLVHRVCVIENMREKLTLLIGSFHIVCNLMIAILIQLRACNIHHFLCTRKFRDEDLWYAK